jgi:hypothetical protein
MNDDPVAFRKKSQENLDVCGHAQADGHCNAAASRYYYALRLAAQSHFFKKGIPAPPFVWEQRERVPNKENRWTHPQLINRIRQEFRGGEFSQMASIVTEAKALREKGDYTDLNVEDNELEPLMERTKDFLSHLSGV